MTRPGNREDVTSTGVEYLLVPGDESYSKECIRVMLQQQQIPGVRDAFTSRPDIRPMFQTSWAGGQRWELPLISATSISVYGSSEGFDMVTQPGNLYALPDVENINAAIINDNPFALQVDSTNTFYFQFQQQHLAPPKWDAANSAPSTRQAQTRRPSSSTLQAPQSPEEQPSLLPVSPSPSRNTSSRVSSGSQRNSTASPLMVVDM